jgi:putative ABC transport system permease protein
MSPATRLHSTAARLAAVLVPRAYRDEVIDDIADARLTAWAEVRAVLASAVDARRAVRRGRHADLDGAAGGSRSGRWGSDLAAAARQLRRRPSAALWIIGTLGAAISLSLALFAVVNAVLLRPLPYRDEGRLVFIWNTQGADRETLTPGRALDIRDRLHGLDGASLIGHFTTGVTGLGAAERWFGASVSANFFDVLGGQPELGRVFHRDEPDRDVVVLSHRLFVERFNADSSVIGQSVTMNGRPRRVLGVMPASFFWPSITYEISAANPPLFWSSADATDVPERPIPFDGDVTKDRASGYLRMVARMRDGVSLGALTAEADGLAQALTQEYPQSDRGRGITAVPARTQLLGSVERPLWLVWCASMLVVFGATVTVANLLVARQSARRREFAVRTALGAGRWRIARQLMAEAAVLAAAGGTAGLFGAVAITRVLVSVAPERVGRLDGVNVDTPVAAMAVVLSLISAVLLGGVAILAWKREPGADALRGAGAAAASGTRLRAVLVGVEIAVAMVLVIGSTLFGESLARLQAVDVGFDTTKLLTFEVALNGERAEYQARQLDFFDRLIGRIRAMPGVVSSGGAVTLPIGGDDWGAGFYVEGEPLPPAGQDRRVGFQVVGDGWFQTLGMRMVRGRDFSATDTRQTVPVIIINETLAAEAFPGQDPVGRRVKYARQADAPVLTVIGVVSDIRHLGPAEKPRPEIYQAYHQFSLSMMAVAVRTEGDPMPLMPAIRAAAAEIDPTQPLSAAATMERHVQRKYGDARFLTAITSMFGGLGLLLAVIGVYGVTSVGVAQRTRELGVRTALGAAPAQLAGEVLHRSLVPVAAGVAAGAAVAAAASQQMGAMLFGTAPLEVSAYLLAAAILVGTAAAASWLPARRAGRIDPVRALRDDA